MLEGGGHLLTKREREDGSRERKHLYQKLEREGVPFVHMLEREELQLDQKERESERATCASSGGPPCLDFGSLREGLSLVHMAKGPCGLHFLVMHACMLACFSSLSTNWSKCHGLMLSPNGLRPPHTHAIHPCIHVHMP